MELVGKKKFVAVAFNIDNKTFVVHITFFASYNLGLTIYPFYKPQIALFILDKILTVVLSEYTAFGNIFSPNFIAQLSKYIRIINNQIDFVNDQQPLY